jgi:hypothetical protein
LKEVGVGRLTIGGVNSSKNGQSEHGSPYKSASQAWLEKRADCEEFGTNPDVFHKNLGYVQR